MSELALDEKKVERPDPEVAAVAKRRRFTAEYKLRIVQEAEALESRGEELGSLLRREGLYSSHLSEWRRAARRGTLTALASKKRGRKRDPERVAKKENERLRRENERLKKKLEQAELVIDVQKKLSRLLDLEDDQKSGSS